MLLDASAPRLRGALLGVLLLSASAAPAATAEWTELAPGLDLAAFSAGDAAPGARIHALRVDPRRHELVLLGLPRGESVGYSARDWARREGLLAAINAGMYHEDYRTHSGHMSADGTVFSRGVNSYLSAAAFEPLDPADPPFRLFDLDVEPLPGVLARYRRVVQNLRLVKRPGQSRWANPASRWSEAALAEDAEGRALLIFCATPLPVEALIATLLAGPLGVVAAQHLEGGHQAQLFVDAGGRRLELVGGREPGEDAAGGAAWPIPNVIGVRARSVPRTR